MSLQNIITCLETGKFTITKKYIDYKGPLNLPRLEVELLSKIKSSQECEDIVTHNTFYKIDKKIFALPKQTLYLYLYYQLLYNFYNTPFKSQTKSISMLKSLQPKTIYIPLMIFQNLSIIHQYIENNLYYISIPPIHLPWSDVICVKLFSSYNYTKVIPLPLESTSDLSLEYNNLIDVATSILNPSDDTMKIISQWNMDDFINKTASIAVGVNGTACAGKTSILNKTLTKIHENIDSNASILKAGKYGGYKGKDNEQILALTYQATLFAAMQEQYTSISDRDMFNNLIWRMILYHMDSFSCTPKNIVDNFISKVSRNLINIMSKQPIVILIDLNVPENRYRMYRRETGGDRKRCFIEYYTPSQNCIYGLFAYLCKWPIFNRTFDDEKQENIINLIYSKIKHNVATYNNKLPILNTLEEGSFSYTKSNETEVTYDIATTLGIFK